MATLCDIYVEPAPSGKDNALEALGRVGASAVRGGNANKEYLLGWADGKGRLTVELPYSDSLDRKYWSGYLREDWANLQEAGRVTVNICAPADSSPGPHISQDDTLYLQTAALFTDG